VLIEEATGAMRYRVEGDFEPRTVFISDDGASMAVIDDFSERQPTPDLDVLVFYHQGVPIKQFTLGELLRDPSNISRSASHFQWFFYPEDMGIVNSKLKLKTYELTSYEFDVRTGELLAKSVDPILTKDTVYVYGEVRALGNRRYEIDVCQQVYGEVPEGGKIQFEAGKGNAFEMNRFDYSLILKDGKLVAREEVILNSCTYQEKHRSGA
jgi:co-chaperonin GroES (HSP10)